MCEIINRKEIKRIYKNQKICFPMIMGVIEGTSEGMIYCDDIQNPRHIFVRNKFGFCQEFFEDFSEEFFNKIMKEIMEDKKRSKLRMYMPTNQMKVFLEGEKNMAKCERVHFQHNKQTGDIPSDTADDWHIEQMFAKKGGISQQFIYRYYKDEKDFIEHAMPIAAYDANGNEIGIIYNTAKGDGNCEIDILVEEQYRNRGIGKALVFEFIKICQERRVIPNWDCYANNVPSMRLAENCGFESVGTYCFYNVDVLMS